MGKKASEIEKQTESVPEETEPDNNALQKSSKSGQPEKPSDQETAENVPEKTAEESIEEEIEPQKNAPEKSSKSGQPEKPSDKETAENVLTTVTKKSSKRGRPKKSANEDKSELALDTQEEAENEGKVQSKESSPRGKSPNDDSAWEDLPNENDPAVVEPVPKSTKRVKKSVLNKLRAISTPNKNESHLQANVTFMDRSEIADISAIPVLSPPTVKKNTRIKPQIKPVRDYGEASFQFRSKRGRGSEDNFDALVQEPKRSKNANEDVGNTTRSGRSTKKNPKYK